MSNERADRAKKMSFDFFMMLLAILPIVDSVNGFLNGGGNDGGMSVGILYRAFVFIYCVFMLLVAGANKYFLTSMIIVFAYCIESVIISSVYVGSYAMLLSRLLLPILMIVSVSGYQLHLSFYKGSLSRLFNIWRVLFPLTILVPYLLGIGFKTYGYGNAAGFKGFYYAQNDVGYILIVLLVMSFFKIGKEKGWISFASIILLIISNLVLGLKSNYVMVSIVVVMYLLIVLIKNKKIVQAVVATAFIFAAIMVFLHFFGGAFNAILTRWTYFYNTQDTLSFITSSRSDRVSPALQWLNGSGNPLYYLFGTGMAYTNATVAGSNNIIEMDLFDILFQLGIVGTFLFYSFLISISRKAKKNGAFFWMFIVSIISSTLAGHVFESALSAMVFGAICVGMLSEQIEEN